MNERTWKDLSSTVLCPVSCGRLATVVLQLVRFFSTIGIQPSAGAQSSAGFNKTTTACRSAKTLWTKTTFMTTTSCRDHNSLFQWGPPTAIASDRQTRLQHFFLQHSPPALLPLWNPTSLIISHNNDFFFYTRLPLPHSKMHLIMWINLATSPVLSNKSYICSTK